MVAWSLLPPAADGARLDQRSYERDFGENLWTAAGGDCWKLERMQEYVEAGFPSWEAFMAGDWTLALRLYEEERPAIAAFHEKLRRQGSRFYRVRVVAEPVTAYLRWELHCLRLRAACGEQIRVVSVPAVSAFEPSGPLPSSSRYAAGCSIRRATTTAPNLTARSATRIENLVARYEDFARGLYESGEDVESYYAREIAHLPPPPRIAPPPRPDAGPGR